MAGLKGIKYLLSSAQLEIVANEISFDPKNYGYAGKTRGGICKLLNDRPLLDNPEEQKQINGHPLSPGKVLRNAGITLAEISTVQADAEGKSIWETFTGLSEIDLNSQLATDCLDKLETKGLLATIKINAIKALGKIPDPNYQAQVAGQNRTEVLLGVGWIIEGPDIRTAQAL